MKHVLVGLLAGLVTLGVLALAAVVFFLGSLFGTWVGLAAVAVVGVTILVSIIDWITEER